MAVRLRQEIRGADVEEDSRVQREQLAERVLGDLNGGAERGTEERCDCDHREPANGGPTAAALAQDEGHGVQTVGEVVGHHRQQHEDPGRGVQAEGEPDCEPVGEGVHRERSGAQRTDTRMRLRLLRIVSVVQDEVSVGDEEEDEPRADERHDPVLVPDRIEGLRNEVEERDGNDDAARERDRRLQLPMQAQTQAAAGERRDDRQTGQRDRDPGHRLSRLHENENRYHLPDAWAEHAREVLREAGVKPGAARAAVIDVVADQRCCLSAPAIHEEVRLRRPRSRTCERLPRASDPHRARARPPPRSPLRRRSTSPRSRAAITITTSSAATAERWKPSATIGSRASSQRLGSVGVPDRRARRGAPRSLRGCA